ncbi:MAG: transketolase [Candidatus Doudnabacteria bacterium]|nr:transketolase [Candidatus Doudnabacteria bacterium]
MIGTEKLQKLAKLIRYFILTSTTEAGSGHPTSSLSAVELMAALLFGGFFRFDLDNPAHPNNDRLIFSKGHASPLFYSLWAAAGRVSEQELLTFRKFGSPLEGHPTPAFVYTEAATGSLGQGLSIGAGMALNAKLDNLAYRTFVLLGDSEMAEGSVWEAVQIAAHYKLNNLIGILDVNRLGQRGETMYGHDIKAYEKRIKSFGWETIVIEDGHNFRQILEAFQFLISNDEFLNKSQVPNSKPVMVIAKTIKGKGVSFLENKDGWHGKALPAEDLPKALAELGEIDKGTRGEVGKPESAGISKSKFLISKQAPKYQIPNTKYDPGKPVATRRAYGNALVNIAEVFPNLVVLDGEVSNSTYAEIFKKAYPERFFEMFIAEQNMVGVALGLSRRGKIPFVSSFAAFLTRAFDQIRMSQYSEANLHPVKSAEGGAALQPFNGVKFCGSHAGVSIGEDGASQMGLEDIAMFRTILSSIILYPSDAVSCERLVEEAAKHKGMVYIRTTRKDTSIIYEPSEEFKIGGSKILRQSTHDRGTVVAAGITLHEALAAYEELKKEGINIRVVDLYSVKPLDVETLRKAAEETKAIITVEDHYSEGGIGEAVDTVLAQILNTKYKILNLAVRKMPRSGKPEELLRYEEIDRSAIIKAVKDLISNK